MAMSRSVRSSQALPAELQLLVVRSSWSRRTIWLIVAMQMLHVQLLRVFT
jgi:hypothetical protein